MSNHQGSDWWYTRVLCHRRIGEAPWGEELYKTLVTSGELQAKEFLVTQIARESAPSLDTIQTVHFLIFREVYPFAGTFRGPNDTLVREQERGASRPASIDRDLDRLQREAARFLQTTSSTHDVCRFIAGYQARLVQIQPFLDGNKRVALRIAGQQVRTLLHQESKLVLGWDHYLEGLDAGMRLGKLGPLSYSLTEEALVGRLAQSPFTMAQTTLHQGLQR